jgi:hypothetical protein
MELGPLVLLARELSGLDGDRYRPLRNRHYHTREDTPDKLDFERLSRAVDDLWATVSDLVGS